MNNNVQLGTTKALFTSLTLGFLVFLVFPPKSGIHRNDKVYTFASDAENGILPKLYKELTDLQYGRTIDKYGWMRVIE